MTDTPPDLQPPAAGGRLVDLPFTPVRIAVLTISDTRDEESDTSGHLLAERVTGAGHVLAGKEIVPDDVEAMFGPYNGVLLKPTSQPPHSTKHVIAVDPGIKHDPFAWIVGHLDPVDEQGRPHLVLDAIRRWIPEEHGGLGLGHLEL